MKHSRYLLDTHALLFWANGVSISRAFKDFFDRAAEQGRVSVSPISFWEIAFLVKKQRLDLPDVKKWKDSLFQRTQLQLLSPTVDDMIASAELPPHHRDPFDRLLIAQAQNARATLVTQDTHIARYAVETTWTA